MDLEALVTDALPQDLQDNSLGNVWGDTYDPVATLRNLRDGQRLFPDGAWQRPLAEATLRLMRRSADRGHYGHVLLVELLEEISGSSSDISSVLESVLPIIEEDCILSSADRAMEYLQDQWGDDAKAMIASCAGVQPPTVGRWLNGGSMTKRKYYRICTAALVYREAQKHLPDQEAAAWIRSPEDDGTSPLEKIGESNRVSRNWIPWELRQSLRHLQETTT